MVSLNSTVSCGTMPMAPRRLACVTSRMSWPSMRIAPALHVVEAVQQPRQRALARARGADHRHRLARRDLEAHVVQDRPLGVVGKAHVLEAHRARASTAQRRRARRVGHLAVLAEQHEHLVHVGQACLISRYITPRKFSGM
jgi:hypothetical protein